MNKVLFRNDINKVTFEGSLKSVKKEIDACATYYALKNIDIVIGRDFIQDRKVYFIYDLNKGFSKLELETIVENYLKGEFNEV